MNENTTDLLALSFSDLWSLITNWGYPRYRADQIWSWLYRQLATSPSDMSNLPLELRSRLAQSTRVQTVTPIDVLSTDDGLTSKVLLQTNDEETIEAVLMRYSERNTVCASSQIGCSLGCAFCATGQGGFRRDLTPGEISAQVLHFARALASEGQRITNIVFMGMGEPLLNYEAVWQSIQNLSDARGLNLGLRRFTISTCGIVPGIERLAAARTPVGLAVSLHAPDDDLRDQLVPINRRYPLAQLMNAVDHYVAATGRRPTFEYALANEVNDSEECAERLALLLRGRLGHVNLIPINARGDGAFRRSTRRRVERFRDILTGQGIATTIRISRGTEISAGCGQLRTRHLAENHQEESVQT